MYAPVREVYFMSDMLHLVKTIRNCWEEPHFGGTPLMEAWVIRKAYVYAKTATEAKKTALYAKDHLWNNTKSFEGLHTMESK